MSRQSRQQRRAASRAGKQRRGWPSPMVAVTVVTILTPVFIACQGRSLAAAVNACEDANGFVTYATSRWFSSAWPGTPDAAPGWQERPLCVVGGNVMGPFRVSNAGVVPEFAWAAGDGALPIVRH